MHVAIRFQRHEFRNLHRAGTAHTPEVVALKVDEHHVLGAFFRMRQQFLRQPAVLQRILAARISPGDRPRADHAVAHLRQPLRRGADHGAAVGQGHQRRERRRVAPAQPAVEIHRISGRRQACAPLARQVDLKHIAGADVVQHPLYAGQKRIRRVVPHRLHPEWSPRPCADALDVGAQQWQQRLLPVSLADQQRRARPMVANNRRRKTRRPGERKHRIAPWFTQRGFDFGAELVGQIHKPAAGERRHPLLPERTSRRVRAPGGVQCGQKRFLSGVGIEGLAGKGEQDVVARRRRVVGDAFEQMRITRRVQRVQVGEVREGLQGLTDSPGGGDARAGSRGVHIRRRITSVPLVPPKPKEFDSATSIFMLRAAPGT